jgi:hypothetical protein
MELPLRQATLCSGDLGLWLVRRDLAVVQSGQHAILSPHYRSNMRIVAVREIVRRRQV